LLTPNVRVTLPTAFLEQLQTALAQSLFWVYMLTFVLAAVGLATMFLLPGGRAEKYAYKPSAGTDVDEETASSEAVPSLISH
jgi:hypothetical protein